MLPRNLRTAAARNAVEQLATKFLAANDNTPARAKEPMYRGGRPAMTWAAKEDRVAAACLWLVARQRLPASVVVANDNEPADGGYDTRRNGSARGKRKARPQLGEYLSLPAVVPRLGDADPKPVLPGGINRQDIRPQNDIDELSDDFQWFGSCADAVAPGAIFVGAENGLGTARPGKSKGSPLKVDECTFDEPPADVDYVIELVLAAENLASIGRAFGATGRYQDRKGAAMLRAAMDWAKSQVFEIN